MYAFTKSNRLAVIVAFTLGACDSEATFAPSLIPPGGTGKTETPVFNSGGRLINPRADSDGDGISDGDELAGWTLTVDSNGFAVGSVGTGGDEALEVRLVTSDPRYADTDGDGLPDGEERAVKSDPRRRDTDGDTLSDFDEVRRWGTSPVSADTDGDARGGDPANPRPPMFALFDAAELRLMPDPAAPDGPWIPGPGATSPLFADTDGDGKNDYEELLSGQRKPTVAEVPKLKLMPTPGAELDLYLNVVRSDGTVDTTTYGSTQSMEESGYIRTRASTTLLYERSDYVAAYAKTVTSAGCCLTFEESETEVGVKYETEDRFESSFSFDMEVGGAFDANTVKSNAEAAETNSEVTISSGTIRLAADVYNSGTVPYRLENMVISVLRYDRIGRVFVPVTEILADDTSLAPGERVPVALVANDVPVQAMLDLLEDPRSLVFQTSRFSLVDQYGVDFDFRMSDVVANSASITIDYGDRADRFHVAANVDPERGVSLGDALAVAGVGFAGVPIDEDGVPGIEAWAIEIGGVGTELHQGVTPDLEDTLPYPVGLEPGARKVKRGWFGGVRPFGGADNAPKFEQNLFDVRVRPGDQVTLIYAEDLDRDGVPHFEEQRMGSSDLTPHSDGDGLSDYWESRVGWTVETAGRAPYRVFPSPVHSDTDGDGLFDDDEAAGPTTDFGTGSDPWLVDTDGDGFSDYIEYTDSAYGLDPSGFDTASSLPQPVVTCKIVPIERATARAPQRYRVAVEATDPQSDLVSLVVAYPFDDARAVYESAPTASLSSSEALTTCSFDPRQITATARDALGLQATVTCAFADGAPVAGEWCNGIDDDCDGVVDEGCPVAGGALRREAAQYLADRNGGYGPSAGRLDCDSLSLPGTPFISRILRSVRIFLRQEGDSVVERIEGFCSQMVLEPRLPPGADEYVYDVTLTERRELTTPRLGGSGGSGGELNCADIGVPNAMVGGLVGRAGGVIDALGVDCYTLVVARDESGVYQVRSQYAGSISPCCGSGGNAFVASCAANYVVSGIDATYGALVDSVQPVCRTGFEIPYFNP